MTKTNSNTVQSNNKDNANDFVFGKQSAYMYEEYNVMKTNEHGIRQRRVMIVDKN